MCAYVLSISSNEGKCRSVSNMSKSHVRLFKGREYLLYLFSNFKLRVLQHSISVCRTSIDVLWTEKYNKNKTILRIPYNYLVNDSFSSCLCEIIHCVRNLGFYCCLGVLGCTMFIFLAWMPPPVPTPHHCSP